MRGLLMALLSFDYPARGASRHGGREGAFLLSTMTTTKTALKTTAKTV